MEHKHDWALTTDALDNMCARCYECDAVLSKEEVEQILNASQQSFVPDVNSDINAPTRTQIKEYVKTLDVIIQRLYEEAEMAYMLTLHDTLSDDFQIVAKIRDVFSSQLKLHQK